MHDTKRKPDHTFREGRTPPGQSRMIRFLFPAFTRLLSQKGAMRLFNHLGRKALEETRGISQEGMETIVDVAALPGMEVESRYWSLAMIFRHCNRIINLIIDICEDLATGRVPDMKMSTSDFGPEEDSTARDRSLYESELFTILLRMQNLHLEESVLTCPHPWLGPLTGHQWICLATLHQWIHLRQIRRIRKALEEKGD